jgi:hypothetical protein
MQRDLTCGVQRRSQAAEQDAHNIRALACLVEIHGRRE